MRLLVLFAGLALAGCASEPAVECGGTYHLDASVSAEQSAPVRAAFAKWNALAGRDVARLEAGDPSDRTCSVRVNEATGNLGLWDPADGSISLAPERMRVEASGCSERMGDCIEATTLHELGHGLGLRDLETPSAVMSGEGELVLEFSASDRVECARAQVCR